MRAKFQPGKMAAALLAFGVFMWWVSLLIRVTPAITNAFFCRPL